MAIVSIQFYSDKLITLKKRLFLGRFLFSWYRLTSNEGDPFENLLAKMFDKINFFHCTRAEGTEKTRSKEGDSLKCLAIHFTDTPIDVDKDIQFIFVANFDVYFLSEYNNNGQQPITTSRMRHFAI